MRQEEVEGGPAEDHLRDLLKDAGIDPRTPPSGFICGPGMTSRSR